ncbi:MAG: hypothetical protein J6B44_05350, partial [Muribaculaceae bacterium]|nr:hypothetical protein [Muribaculaceae bacterium]
MTGFECSPSFVIRLALKRFSDENPGPAIGRLSFVSVFHIDLKSFPIYFDVVCLSALSPLF